MRRIIFLALTIFFLFGLSAISPKSASAQQCQISLDRTEFPSDFNGQIGITSTTDCFQTSTEYIILAYPQSEDRNPEKYSNYSVHRIFRADPRSIVSTLNLLDATLDKQNLGTWIIKVCNAKVLINCGDNNRVLGRTTFSVTSPPSEPTPTTPVNLPKIVSSSDSSGKARCVFQAGEEVKLLVTNILPKTNYRWWLSGERSMNPVGRSDEQGSNMTVTIPGTETSVAEKRQACVDIEGIRRTGQNCISLNFTAGPPTGDTSCASQNQPNQLNVPESNRVICSEGLDEKGDITKDPEKIKVCKKINTAIAAISTNPKEFVTQIFGIILGLSGGIALILIIISGYRIMASSGNPEALQAGREQLVSAIVGLLFIIFSFVILQVIGVEILKIPGFNP